jgi:ABC-type sugar transport system permease subunit
MLEQLSQKLPKLPSFATLRAMQPLSRREMRNGLLFLSPWLLGFLAFTLIPMVATLIFSFLNLRITDGIFSTPKFVGFENYRQLWVDPQAGINPLKWFASKTPSSLLITIKFALIALPVGIFFPLGLALLMNNKYLKGQFIFRSLFYMPYIVPFVASVFLWGGMLNTETGWINRFLLYIGVAKESLPQWANDVNWVYPTYVIMGIWGVGNAMLIMLAGLQGVPTELYDAAKVDGANSWKTFWNITFPMISPVIFYNLTLNIIGLFQYFLVPLVVNNGTGRPGGATMFYNLYLYKTFFTYQNMSYGSALAWFLFLVILLITILLFWSAKYWVYYAGEARS